ncbi:transcription factor bHLH118-like [Cucurbita moschata]|uniref:Transcription factor bHLH118-like n=1 Tax=Cucurbita moschata TaxID=3662 RepID=A0A6J1EAE1_CUCMO|nr:transcription factor bHLH118-like [Cucurbita moschata]
MFPFNHPSHHHQPHQLSGCEGSSELNPNKIESTHNEVRKIVHRDLERERRKQMLSLLTNLRSLLPLQLVEGRRTRADIVDEAVNYIEHFRGKISELHVKRDAIKGLHLDESSDLCPSSCVVIKPYSGGLEIVISIFREQNLELSEVMRVLLEESIEITSCASTKVKEMMLHTIHTKVDDPTRIDVHELQQKLYRVCTFVSFGA